MNSNQNAPDYPIYLDLDDKTLIRVERPDLTQYGTEASEASAPEQATSSFPMTSNTWDYNDAPRTDHPQLVFSHGTGSFYLPSPPRNENFELQEVLPPWQSDPEARARSTPQEVDKKRTKDVLMTEPERKPDKRERDRGYSAKYLEKKKEELNELETKRSELNDELNTLIASNEALKAILDEKGVKWQSMEERIFESISLEHQLQLEVKEEAVRVLDVELEQIKANPAKNRSTKASKMSRTNRKLSAAKAERDIVMIENSIMQEKAVGVMLNELIKENTLQTSQSTRYLSTNNSSGTGVPLLPNHPRYPFQAPHEEYSVLPSYSNLIGTGVPLPLHHHPQYPLYASYEEYSVPSSHSSLSGTAVPLQMHLNAHADSHPEGKPGGIPLPASNVTDIHRWKPLALGRAAQFRPNCVASLESHQKKKKGNAEDPIRIRFSESPSTPAQPYEFEAATQAHSTPYQLLNPSSL